MKSLLKSIDILADDEAPIHRINFKGKTAYQSTLGGFCTFLITVIFFFILWIESEDVIQMKYPLVQTRELDTLAQEPVLLKDLPPIYFELKDAYTHY